METKQMSRSSLEDLWNKTYGEDLPSGRPKPAKMDSYYPISTMNVALDEGKPVAYRGFGNIGDYNFIGMSYTMPEYRNKSIYSKLEPPMQGKVIVGLSQRNTGFKQEDWVNYFKGKGFTINPSDEELDEMFGEGHEEITHHFIRFYRNHDKNTWAAKNTSAIAKWWGIVKQR